MRRSIGILWLLLLMVAAPAFGQTIIERLITPGPLASAHAKLESKCDSCHTSFRKAAQNDRCIACHRKVGADIASRRGFHGKFTPARTEACKTCHSDHKGRGYALIHFATASFNHAFADYQLTGAHQRARCDGCHTGGRKYRDAPTTCVSCHQSKDPHRGQLGRDCQSCHDTADWKKPKPFDHSTTHFALTGAHRTAGCLTCHAGERWKGLGISCIACHAKDDAHKGSRGTNCASCHTTTSWKSVTFDHDTTGFPLVGGHAQASCASCHGANNSIKKPPRTCNACHARDDVHKGANGSDCAGCHTVRSWKQIAFDHDRLTDFPLKGAHRDATCRACHAKPAKQVKLAVTCISCHAKDDAHKGAFGTDCARCHTAVAWKGTAFDHDRMTKFPLAGKHATAKCEACHTQPAEKVKLSTACGSCHAKDDVHLGKLGQDCARCHDANDWKSHVSFDHALSRFPLLGKHAAVACKDCHADRTFSAKGIACASCHVDDHHKGTLGTPSPCGTCHDARAWKDWRFDHDRQTSFALTGQHKGLICAACHVRAGNPAKVSSTCIDCHRRDDIHRGGFGGDCQRCHTTESFSVITMKQNGL